MSCYFSGGSASLEVILLTDPDRAAQATVKPADITHADAGGRRDGSGRCRRDQRGELRKP